MSEPVWAEWTDEQLLALRMRELDLKIEGTPIEGRIARLNAEIEARGLEPPHYYIADEWFTPDGVPGIAIPFYLAHPRLEKLELSGVLGIAAHGAQCNRSCVPARIASPRSRTRRWQARGIWVRWRP